MNTISQTRRFIPALSAFIFLSSQAVNSFAGSSGYIGAEYRHFLNTPLYENQHQDYLSISSQYEFHKDFSESEQQLVLNIFGRLDEKDDNRTHLNIKDMYWWKNLNEVEIYVGVRKVFWGVTESVHLVDVINQTNLVENPNREEKFGQPMVEFVFERDWGTTEFYILPYFIEQELPGEEGRFRGPIPIRERVTYHSDSEERHTDYALRWSHYIGIWDFGLSHFSGTSRDPRFDLVWDDNGDVTEIQLHYEKIDQTGIDLQATIESWLWKLEVISRKVGGGKHNTLAAGGFEYSFYSVFGSNSDIGVIAEYQLDDREDLRQSAAQNDLALGIRWALNDIDGSEVLFLVNKDLEYDNTLVTFETSKRLTDNWKLEAQAAFFIDIEPGSAEYAIRDDDYLQLEVRRYF